MSMQGFALPEVLHTYATNFDAWRLDEGVAVTISDKDGKIYAGCSIGLEQWLELVNYVNKQFGLRTLTEQELSS